MGLEAIHIVFDQRRAAFCICLEKLSEAEFKSNRLTFFDRGSFKIAYLLDGGMVIVCCIYPDLQCEELEGRAKDEKHTVC